MKVYFNPNQRNISLQQMTTTEEKMASEQKEIVMCSVLIGTSISTPSLQDSVIVEEEEGGS